MIHPRTGEVRFRQGFVLRPLMRLPDLEGFTPDWIAHRQVAGWHEGPMFSHFLGLRESEHGWFDVEVMCDARQHVHVILLNHQDPACPDQVDGRNRQKRRHAEVLEHDLFGLTDFDWGLVEARSDRTGKNWILIYYRSGLPVPGGEVIPHRKLAALQGWPKG